MGNRGIGHQPLDVLLADCREGAQHHRGDRDEHHDLLPVERHRLEGLDHDAHEHAIAAIFGAAAKNAVTGVGAPS
jgi:hypothetical protein